MGFLNKLFGKSEAATLEREEAPAVTCPHTTLTPSWDSVADMGNEDKVTGYTCQGCSEQFTPAEGRALKASEAQRVSNLQAVDESEVADQR